MQLCFYNIIPEERLKRDSALFLPPALNSIPLSALTNEFSACAETFAEQGGLLGGGLEVDEVGREGVAARNSQDSVGEEALKGLSNTASMRGG